MKASKFYGMALALLLCGLSAEAFAQKNLEEVVRKCKSDKSVDKSVVTKKDPATKQKRRIVSSFEVESGSPLYQEVMTAFERDKEEAYQIIGRPLGIGGSMYFLDQLIADTVDKEPYKSTRVWTVGQLLDNLKKGYPVPVRVGNATYRDDPSLKGGHYVVLIGFENGNAVLVDSDEPTGIFKCPWERFFSAMIQDQGLISAWDTTGEKAKK